LMSEYYETTADKFVFRVKKDLQYSKDEVWVKRQADGSIKVGLTDFAQRRAGDLVFAESQPVGTKVVGGGFLGSYETVKMVQDILSPADGEIIDVNPDIELKPEVINRDPYGEGWVTVIKPDSNLSGLLSAEEYFEVMKVKVVNELKKIKGM
jgi:glycine cleavage system H protein